MILTPLNRNELLAQLARNFPEGGRVESVDMRALAAVMEHHPEDMTASVEAGMTVAGLQETLRLSGQWLPIDPRGAERLTIGDLLAYDFSGSRRLGYGTIRDYLIGIKVALADGTLIKAGGKVVKNVAGYDLCKLFIGARHTLGIIVEAAFKLRPMPEHERFLRAEVGSMEELETLRAKLLTSRAEPVLFDTHNLSRRISAIAAFAGNREDVGQQVTIAQGMGMSATDSVDYAEGFFGQGEIRKVSVLPSRVIEALSRIGSSRWLAHLGSGVIFHRSGNLIAEPPMPLMLMSRVKQAYDPKGIFPNYTA